MSLVRACLLPSPDGSRRGAMPAARAAQRSSSLPLLMLLSSAFVVGCGAEDRAPASADASPAPSADTAVADAVAPRPPGSLEAVALELGTAVDADGRVAAPSERVRAGDAVHVSLVTVGDADAADLAIAWRDASGTEIDADEREITAAGPAVHTFSRQPEGGWAPGRYEAEVRIDGESAGVRAFEVR